MNIYDEKQVKPAVGVSSCLLGNEVRYDGTDKYCPYIVDALGELFSLTAFCPEVAIGLGIPRPPIQLVSMDDEIHLRGVDEPHQDVTDEMQAYVQGLLAELQSLSGYIVKARSPSCGLADVPVYNVDGSPVTENASGLFAQAIQELFPELPVTNEEAMLEEKARNDFISQVLNYFQARQA